MENTNPKMNIDEKMSEIMNFNESFFEDIISMLMDNTREPKDPFIDTLSDDDIVDMTLTVYELADEYVNDHIIEMHNPLFHKIMVDDITSILFDQWEDADLCSHGEDDDDPEDDYEDVNLFIKDIIGDYFKMSSNWDNQKVPLRSYPNTFINNSLNINEITTKVTHVQSIPQPSQRTPEWYDFRHGLITASNLYKVFGSEALYNSLIYEKCLPLDVNSSNMHQHVNTSSPMHWGQKYEPVSVLLYEKMYNTRVEDFGCIQHSSFSYIGASPDGIITDPTSDRFGRMLEIKNIVNREITVPSKAYWIQMQVQMETCDLDECDFIETRFNEYANADTFYAGNHEHRGIILYFVERVDMRVSNPSYSGAPNYVYMPLSIELNKENIDIWIETTMTSMRSNWSLYTTIYWHLDEISCVLVERNRLWFKHAQPLIENAWNIILKERKTGYGHRAVKKKTIKLEVVDGDDGTDNKRINNMPVLGGVCLVKLE
jgi:putative phage-type endonuclease